MQTSCHLLVQIPVTRGEVIRKSRQGYFNPTFVLASFHLKKPNKHSFLILKQPIINHEPKLILGKKLLNLKLLF
jgi:hypothetical protein